MDTITYTFPADCPVAALRGRTLTGGVFCRIDGKAAGTPDAVRFAERVEGNNIIARIAGKPELEAALASQQAAAQARAARLAAIKWPEFEAVQRRAENAAHAYTRASEHGYPVDEAIADREAYAALEAARLQYPLAALYARALSYREASHYAKSGAGRRAMEAIEQGTDPAQAVASMEAEWADLCRRSVD